MEASEGRVISPDKYIIDTPSGGISANEKDSYGTMHENYTGAQSRADKDFINAMGTEDGGPEKKRRRPSELDMELGSPRSAGIDNAEWSMALMTKTIVATYRLSTSQGITADLESYQKPIDKDFTLEQARL